MTMQRTRSVSKKIIPMPILETTIPLDEIGYAGWHAVMQLNPRPSVYDNLMTVDLALGQDEQGKPTSSRWWTAFGKVVLDWNFGYPDGTPVPLPRDVLSEAEMDLPVGVLTYIYDEWVKRVNKATEVPKAPESDSSSISSISGEALLNGSKELVHQ